MDSGHDLQEDIKVAVSRSGRVRKKSSKLNDFFESPEELPSKPKRGSGRPAKKLKIPPECSNSDSSESSDEDDDLSDVDLKGVVGFDNQWDDLDDGSDLLSGSKNDSDDDVLRMADTVKSASYQFQGFSTTSKKRSQKKKQNRKDKGKTRLTAYMLWSKHVRGEIVQQNPNMDFSAVNKRLGELWGTVPTAQKYNWQNKATKIAVRSEKQSRGSMISTGKRKQVGHKAASGKGPGRKPDLKIGSNQPNTPQRQGFQSPKQSKLSLLLADQSPPGVFKVTGTSPIDVAAHLKLLGESLNNIGQKLKEHEGQIAVSGSLSVLLDSMLCVLGPLACLTNEIDVMTDAIPEETRNRILDNIAYIMPGIV